MTILTLAKSEDRVYRAADTLDGLWAEAEQLGRVELRTPMFSSGGKYEAEISFRRASGTAVYAKGKSDDRLDALRSAIAEAVELGAAA
jgi:hypothetical protein